MNLSPAVRPQLGQRIAQTHQHQVAAEGGVDGEIMVLHLQRDQVAAQRRRNPTQEVGGGERRGARFRSGRHGQGGDPGSLGICGRAQALLDEQAEHHGDGGREQGVLGKNVWSGPEWNRAAKPGLYDDDLEGAGDRRQHADQGHAAPRTTASPRTAGNWYGNDRT